jgi:hypothetical protein
MSRQSGRFRQLAGRKGQAGETKRKTGPEAGRGRWWQAEAGMHTEACRQREVGMLKQVSRSRQGVSRQRQKQAKTGKGRQAVTGIQKEAGR